MLAFSKCKKSLFVGFLFLNIFTSQAINDIKDIKLDPINTFDEVPVEIIVKGYLKFETDVIITDARLAYVNVEELFKNLGIYCVVENNGNTLTGFIENEKKPYQIDFDSKQIIIGDRTVISINGIVKELDAIYIETSVLNEAFGLNMLFNFRSLSIKLEADFELPMVKKARLEKIRQNVSILQSKNEEVIDTIIGRNYHLFNGGVMDWSISSYQSENEKPNNQFSLGLGSELLYGEAKVAFNYYDQTKFDRRQLYYNWRWVENDNKFIKQAEVGKIGSQSISFLGAPLVGASFNNSPNTIRKATGTYTISDYTEPNWTVELYINDALVDYTEADASGFYTFKVPIVYGYTTLKLKFYGPQGEERIDEKTMNTPYTFMPAKEIEYNVSGGILEDDEGNRFGRGEVNYGVNRFLTIGGGVEYLSKIDNHPLIPFAKVAFQPFSKMVINMEYAHDVSLKGLLNYYFGRSAFLEVDYSKYIEGQQATLNKTNEERKVRLSLPFKISRINAQTKFSFNQYVYDVFNFNQFDAQLSSRYKNYSANASLASNWIDDQKAYMTSTLVLSRRLNNGLILRPSLQYNITDSEFMRIRAEVEKRISKMSFSASYERNIQYGTNNLFFSFKYDLPFARTGFSSSYSNDQFSFSESAQGSLAFGADNGVVKSGNNSAMGKGGVLLYPFIDINHNGVKDTNEPMVFIKNVKVSGAKAITSEKDSIIRISDLNAFINYDIKFSDAELNNISWKFKHKTYQVLVDPNQYKKIEVPILVLGEINGMISLTKDEIKEGLGRITLQIYDKKGTKVAETLSESDGYFSYLGLKPGEYNIRIDEQQLQKLGYQAEPLNQKVNVKVLADGDIIQGLDFILKSKQQETADTAISESLKNEELAHLKTENEVQKELNEETQINRIIDPSFRKISDLKGLIYSVQIGVYKKNVTAKDLLNLHPIYYEFLADGTTRFISGTYTTKKEAKAIKNKIVALGIKDAYVVAYYNGQKIAIYEIAKFLKQQQVESTLSPPNNEQVTIENKPAKLTISAEKPLYSVQLGVFKKKLSVKELYELHPIYVEMLPNGDYRYLYGIYETAEGAMNAKNGLLLRNILGVSIIKINDMNTLQKIE